MNSRNRRRRTKNKGDGAALPGSKGHEGKVHPHEERGLLLVVEALAVVVPAVRSHRHRRHRQDVQPLAARELALDERGGDRFPVLGLYGKSERYLEGVGHAADLLAESGATGSMLLGDSAVICLLGGVRRPQVGDRTAVKSLDAARDNYNAQRTRTGH
jgi:hypothetical protein